MSTLNPKNPIVILALAGAAVWLLTRRPIAAATGGGQVLRPASPSSTPGVVAAVANAIGGLFPTQTATQQVRSDVYYGGPGSISGAALDAWAAQVAEDTSAWAAYVGTADDATGDPYNPGW